MANPDAGYGSAKDAGAGYGTGKDAGTAYANSKDAGSGYPSPADAGADQPATLFGNGVNLQPSYSSNGNADLGWDYLKKFPAIKTVRILVEPDKYNQAVRWVTEAQDKGYDVIVCYNKSAVLGSSDPAELLAAANWWKDHFAQLKGKAGITVNLMNEWGGHGLQPDVYADACNQALAIVRQVYKNRVILDAPGYGQGATALLQAITGNKKIADRNIMLSVHVYPSAYDALTGKALQNDALKKLNDTGLPCMLGEFGSKAQSSGASWSGLVDFSKSLNWPVLAWCWAADNTGGPGDPNQIDMNMIESPTMIQQKKSSQYVEFDPLVSGKAAPYATSSYFKEVAPRL
jgi:mannan endo-1,4-beta-mannosidase